MASDDPSIDVLNAPQEVLPGQEIAVEAWYSHNLGLDPTFNNICLRKFLDGVSVRMAVVMNGERRAEVQKCLPRNRQGGLGPHEEPFNFSVTAPSEPGDYSLSVVAEWGITNDHIDTAEQLLRVAGDTEPPSEPPEEGVYTVAPDAPAQLNVGDEATIKTDVCCTPENCTESVYRETVEGPGIAMGATILREQYVDHAGCKTFESGFALTQPGTYTFTAETDGDKAERTIEVAEPPQDPEPPEKRSGVPLAALALGAVALSEDEPKE